MRSIILILFSLTITDAQITTGPFSGPMTCNTNVSVTPTMRAEGHTEQTGDITISCIGGTNIAPGQQIPAVNIQVFLNTQITSRLMPIAGGPSNASEALLLLDEPGSGLPGYGPGLPQKVCPTPSTGCTQFVGTAGGATLGTAVDACVTPGVGGCTTTSTQFGANVFQGIVSGNSVTFFGIPVLPAVTTGAVRVFRITNIRADATSLNGGPDAGATAVIASLSISGATTLLISDPTPVVGFVQSGLVGTASGFTNLSQCNSVTRASINTLTFTENFTTAFKTRIAAQTTHSMRVKVFRLLLLPITRMFPETSTTPNRTSFFRCPPPTAVELQVLPTTERV